MSIIKDLCQLSAFVFFISTSTGIIMSARGKEKNRLFKISICAAFISAIIVVVFTLIKLASFIAMLITGGV